MRENKTAILIFTRSPLEESYYKKLHENKRVNEQLHTALYNKTIQIAEATQLPFFIIGTSIQQGGNFGEKLAHAIDFVFKKNYTAVLAIGNDCPQLSADILLDAAINLKTQQLVLGPDRNGGIYLLGIQAEIFNARLFSTIPWQTKNVFTSLVAYGNSCSQVAAILPQLSDFNTRKDYHFLKNIHHSFQEFIQLLGSIISGVKAKLFLILICICRFRYLNIKQFRAPPCYCVS